MRIKRKKQAVCPDSNSVSVMGRMKMGWLSRQDWDNLSRERKFCVQKHVGTAFIVLVQDQDQSPFLLHLNLHPKH